MELKHEGERYEISPWQLMWDDENYYLIGFDHKARYIKHFRVDKMLDIQMCDHEREGEETFEKSMPEPIRKKYLACMTERRRR